MKKYLFLVSVAVVGLTACTNESVEYVGNSPQVKEIAFSPLSKPSTRAYSAAEYNAVEGTGFPLNYDMKVVAYSVPKTSADGVAGNFFGGTTGATFKYNYKGGTEGGTNNYWGAETTAQYWPLAQAALNFLAVSYAGSPTTNKVTPTFSSNWASSVSVALADNQPATANSGATLGQHDLMYAFGRGTVTQDGNVLSIPEKVDMTFNHALAWVYFRVKGDAAAVSRIVIESITLKNAYYAGTFNAEVTNYDSYSSDLGWSANTKWTAASTKHDVASPNQTINADGDGNSTNESQALTTSFAPVGDGILVVPTSEITTPTPSFDSFVIKYWMNGRTYSYTYVPTDRTLVKGKKYIYDITMKLSEIFINPSVTDWDETGNNGVFVDIPSYAIGTDWDYGTISAAAATYQFAITGKTGTLSVASTSSATAFDGTPSVSGDVVTFKVAKNETGADRNYKLVVTDDMGTAGDTSDDKTSNITFTQGN